MSSAAGSRLDAVFAPSPPEQSQAGESCAEDREAGGLRNGRARQEGVRSGPEGKDCRRYCRVRGNAREVQTEGGRADCVRFKIVEPVVHIRVHAAIRLEWNDHLARLPTADRLQSDRVTDDTKPTLTTGPEPARGVKLGPTVDEFEIGDRVTVEVHAGCGRCQRCREGMYTSCLNYGYREKGHRADVLPDVQPPGVRVCC